MKMGQFMKVLTSAGVALALSFLFYGQQDLSGESYRGRGPRGPGALYGYQAEDYVPPEAGKRTVTFGTAGWTPRLN